MLLISGFLTVPCWSFRPISIFIILGLLSELDSLSGLLEP